MTVETKAQELAALQLVREALLALPERALIRFWIINIQGIGCMMGAVGRLYLTRKRLSRKRVMERLARMSANEISMFTNIPQNLMIAIVKQNDSTCHESSCEERYEKCLAWVNERINDAETG